MRLNWLLIASCSVFGSAAMSQDVISRFDDGRDGWLVTGNSVEIPSFRERGGRPGGFILFADGSNDIAYWSAPAKFLGNQAAAFGRWLTFDLAQSKSDCQTIDETDVLLIGGGQTISTKLAWNPDAGWTSFRVALSEAGNWRDDSQELVDDATIQSVLSNLAGLRIRAEFRSCDDELLALDNVVLHRRDADPPKTKNIFSAFDSADHGWTASGTADIGAATPTWEEDGGRGDTDGYAFVEDARNEIVWWDAPQEFTGDVSGALGRWLSFDLSQQETDCQTVDLADVILRGGGLMLTKTLPYNPYAGWTSYRVGFDELAGWRRFDTGELASEPELRRTLQSLDQILIRGEFRSCGEESVGIDNVLLDLGSRNNSPLTQNVRSDFETDTNGWTAVGIALNAIRPAWADRGGRGGGGSIQISDQGSDIIYWDAPAAYLGNLTNARDGSLVFNLTQEKIDCQTVDLPDVILRGGGYSLLLRLPLNPSAGWTSYRVRFDTSQPWVNEESNEQATALEIERTLEHVDQILLRGEFRSCGDESIGLDHVVLELNDEKPVRRRSIRSEFSNSNHGWTALGAGALGAIEPRFKPTGGITGLDGYIEVSDGANEGATYWDAPDSFLGDVSSALDGFLEYRLRQSKVDCQTLDLPDIILRGSTRTLVFYTSANPDKGWTPFSIRLSEFDGWLDAVSREQVTRDELIDVLRELDQLLIRGEFRSCGEEEMGLDSVRLIFLDDPIDDSDDVAVDDDDGGDGMNGNTNGGDEGTGNPGEEGNGDSSRGAPMGPCVGTSVAMLLAPICFRLLSFARRKRRLTHKASRSTG